MTGPGEEEFPGTPPRPSLREPSPSFPERALRHISGVLGSVVQSPSTLKLSSKTARQPNRPCSLSAVISPSPPIQIKKPSFTEFSLMALIRYQTSYFTKITTGNATTQKCQLRGSTPSATRESTSHRVHAPPKNLLLDMLLIIRFLSSSLPPLQSPSSR